VIREGYRSVLSGIGAPHGCLPAGCCAWSSLACQGFWSGGANSTNHVSHQWAADIDLEHLI
jgi:hypothetical protein